MPIYIIMSGVFSFFAERSERPVMQGGRHMNKELDGQCMCVEPTLIRTKHEIQGKIAQVQWP